MDGDCDNNSSGGGQHYYSDSHHHHQFYIQHQTSAEGQQQESSNNEVFDDNADARSDISQCSRGSRGSTSREESETRLQQIKASPPDTLFYSRLLLVVRGPAGQPFRPAAADRMLVINSTTRRDDTTPSGKSLFARIPRPEVSVWRW